MRKIKVGDRVVTREGIIVWAVMTTEQHFEWFLPKMFLPEPREVIGCRTKGWFEIDTGKFTSNYHESWLELAEEPDVEWTWLTELGWG